jgi:hypothetical protein
MNSPKVRFYRFVDGARLPQRADRSAVGTLPMRAVRYCEAVCSATAFGWWLFSPVDCWVLYDGTSMFWSQDGETWLPLSDACHFPGFPQAWNKAAPAQLADMCPPFLTALCEHGGFLQLQFGLMARAAPDWGLLIRRPANFPLMTHIEHFEGIVEPESWFGPLFINLRLTKTDAPIRLRADLPLAQVQPIPRSLYSDAVLADVQIAAAQLAEFSETEWSDYSRRVAWPNTRPSRPYGAYAVETRKRRKRACPILPAAA